MPRKTTHELLLEIARLEQEVEHRGASLRALGLTMDTAEGEVLMQKLSRLDMLKLRRAGSPKPGR